MSSAEMFIQHAKCLLLTYVYLFLYQMAQMYAKDPLNLDLALDYWCPPEPLTDSYHHRPPQKQVFVSLSSPLIYLAIKYAEPGY